MSSMLLCDKGDSIFQIDIGIALKKLRNRGRAGSISSSCLATVNSDGSVGGEAYEKLRRKKEFSYHCAGKCGN